MLHITARRAYSAEQLLALRRSASDEPATAIQTKAEESAIKDHVVRGARSFAARSSNSSLPPRTIPPPVDSRVFGVPVLGELDPNNQNVRAGSSYKISPTPSFKKQRAAQILQQHSSPPNVRVTAGGRIVPSDQSPLCSPRYGFSAISKNGGLIKLAPGYPPPKTFQQFAKSLPNGFVAQDPTGRLCQMVDGRFLPVHEMNGIPQLYITAPNLSNVSSGKMSASSTRPDGLMPPPNDHRQPGTVQAPTGPTISAQILALEKQYKKLEVDRRSLDKAEVLQRSEMTGKAYTQLINKRRELISCQDELRRSIKALEVAKANAEAPNAPDHMSNRSPEMTRDVFKGMAARPSLPQWNVDSNGSNQTGMMSFSGVPDGADFGIYVPAPFFATQMPPFAPIPPYLTPGGMMSGGFQSHGDFAGTGQQANQPYLERPPVYADQTAQAVVPRDPDMLGSSESNGHASGATQALPQPARTAHGQKSSLNPMSAIYEPTRITLTTPERKPVVKTGATTADTARIHDEWAGSAEAHQSGRSHGLPASAHHSSECSFATADFFPQNPRDHSMNKQSYPETEAGKIDEQTKVTAAAQLPSSDDAQISPEKEWHNPNWNPTIPDHAFRASASQSDEQPWTGASQRLSDENVERLPAESGLVRSKLCVSPRSRPALPMIQRTDTQMASFGSPGPSLPIRLAQPDKVDFYTPSFTKSGPASDEYTEGFDAGLSRAPIEADKGKVFLDGYCAGLLQSAQVSEPGPRATGTETTFTAEEVGASPVSGHADGTDRRSSVIQRPPLELNTKSLDTLKQAMFGPSNENAVLSPTEEAPHVTTVAGKNFGVWSKSREPSVGVDSVLSQLRNGQTTFPERTSSMVKRQLSCSSSASVNHVVSAEARAKQSSSGFSVGPSGAEATERRDFSAQTQPAQSSYLHRAYSGHRVLSSPALEWKSGSSIAHVAGLATGYFAQYDGTAPKSASAEHDGTQHKHTPAPPKFKEATMSNSDEPTLSAPTSPQGSPSKKPSPAKARFAQIAGRAGIKVGGQKTGVNEPEQEQMSPQERRKWRDLWKKRNVPATE